MGKEQRLGGLVVVAILAVIIPAVWIVSYAYPVSLNNVHYGADRADFRAVRFSNNCGEVAFGRVSMQLIRKPSDDIVQRNNGFRFTHDKWETPPHFHLLGFAFEHNASSSQKILLLYLPIWPFAFIGSIPLLLRLGRIWIGRDRSRRVQCAACGYDIRSSPMRCP